MLLLLVLIVQNLKNLKKATTDSKQAKKMFMEIDKDGSGGIDIFEFTELINILSLNMDKEEIEEVNITTTLLFLFLL